MAAPTTTVEGDLRVTGKSDLDGAVTIKAGLDMSGAEISNVRNLQAARGILEALTLAGRTGGQSDPYNIWAGNAANSSLLGG